LIALAFTVLGAARLEYAAVPTLRLTVRVEADAPVRSILLDVQVQIAARRRHYDAAAHDRLFELFGPPADWGTTLRTLLWQRSTVVVPAFTGSAEFAVDVPCTYDLEVAAARYLAALEDGVVPLELLFSGSVFAGSGPALQVTRLPWELEAGYALPVAVWREVMDTYFRGTAWVRLRRDAFDRLAAYKSRHALATWEEALDALLATEVVPHG
jgi:Family of unknown function (DUF6084)